MKKLMLVTLILLCSIQQFNLLGANCDDNCIYNGCDLNGPYPICVSQDPVKNPIEPRHCHCQSKDGKLKKDVIVIPALPAPKFR